MNVNVILKMIQPHINNQLQISYENFEKVFSMLDRKEQYEVVNILVENDIELVDVMDEQSLESVNPKEQEVTAIPIFLKDTTGNLTNEHLCILYQQGDKRALDLLIEKNLKLIYSYAIRYTNYYNHKLDIEDLVQMGGIGIMKAAEKFDISKECKFSTYSTWWIKQAILRGIADEGFTIRIPVHLFEVISKITNIERDLNCESFQELLEVVHQECEIDKSRVIELLKIRDQLINLKMLNQLVGETEESELVDFIPNNSPTPEDEVINLQLKEIIDSVLETLAVREKEVLRLRFGIDDDWEHTLEDIGKRYGVTRERIRQIEAKALRKMRHPSRSEKLEAYFAY